MDADTQIINTDGVTRTFRYGGFWIRLLAFLIDGMISTFISFILFGEAIRTKTMEITNGVAQQNSSVQPENYIHMVYIVIFWILYSSSPGKMLFRLKIINTDGSNISWYKAIGRYLLYIPSILVFCLGFISIGFNAKKQGWHDLITKTYVIYK